jgi:hypothetical protein
MRRLLASPLLAVVLLGAGCDTDAPRTSKRLLERYMWSAFIRAYETERRMTTGESAPPKESHTELGLLAALGSSCRPLEPNPRDHRDWHWGCRLHYRDRTGREGRPFYTVAVDPRGCFAATSADFPRRVREAILDRDGPNPLASFRSCP